MIDKNFKERQNQKPCIVHRLGVGKAVVVGEQVTLSILLIFLCNISFRLSCAAQTLVVED
jgi:hypothetical protein